MLLPGHLTTGVWMVRPTSTPAGTTDHSRILIDCLEGSFRQDVRESVPEFESERLQLRQTLNSVITMTVMSLEDFNDLINSL